MPRYRYRSGDIINGFELLERDETRDNKFWFYNIGGKHYV